NRPFHPHITLARARERGPSAALRGLGARLGTPPLIPAFTAREFLLYESFLGPGGSRYEVRARFPLVVEPTPR
ncbi:MAG: hypothetical protein WCE75_06915, partial [Terracidiphilus sp.]